MCMNCGCGQPAERHGNAANITEADLRRAAESNGQSLRETAANIAATVEQVERSGGDGLASPAGPRGAADASGAGRGTPESES